MLCGAYLLMCEDVSLHALCTIFQPVLQYIWQPDSQTPHQVFKARVKDCWKAINHAKSLQWVSNTAYEAFAPRMDIEMARHYALHCNGGAHILIPGKLLLFPAPKALPLNQAWADVLVPGQPTARRFSATFFAGLLPELGVSAVVCLGRTSGTAAAAFRAGGLDVHDLALDAGQPALLGAMDRLLSVSRAAPGATALFPGSGRGGAELEWVRTLAAAWLMTDCGFGSGAAAAWVRMVCPAGWPP
jgi:hypothetical protein